MLLWFRVDYLVRVYVVAGGKKAWRSPLPRLARHARPARHCAGSGPVRPPPPRLPLIVRLGVTNGTLKLTPGLLVYKSMLHVET